MAEGPIRIAGSSYLTADVTTLGPDTRAFYALSVGTSPADARIVQNNVLPQREPEMITDQRRRYADRRATLRPALSALDVVMTAKHAALEPWWHPARADDREVARAALARLDAAPLADRFGEGLKAIRATDDMMQSTNDLVR